MLPVSGGAKYPTPVSWALIKESTPVVPQEGGIAIANPRQVLLANQLSADFNYRIHDHVGHVISVIRRTQLAGIDVLYWSMVC
jgi:hypothetical protein